MSEGKNIDDVKRFWSENPLWTGESAYEPGTMEFYEEHREVYISDCFAGKMDERIFPEEAKDEPILDLGCGVGFWLIEFAKRGFKKVNGADLTLASLKLAKTRTDLYGYDVSLTEQNAESMTFPDGSFQHVNCLGVVHHTPHPDKAIGEIARILKPNGTASISVYYKNAVIRAWPILRPFALALGYFGAKMKGRGREGIYKLKSVDDVIRYYDGDKNPIGIGYTRSEFVAELEKHYEIEEIYFHFFPARSFPIPIPRFLHRILEWFLPFMIVGKVRKKG